MRPSDAYARLLDLGVATVETADVATVLRVTTSAATKLLGRLAAAKLILRLRSGLWLLARSAPDPYSLAEAITAPMSSYVSLQTALYLHGMIEQVPGVIYVASLARTQKITTSVGVFSVHHSLPNCSTASRSAPPGRSSPRPRRRFSTSSICPAGARACLHICPSSSCPRGFAAAHCANGPDVSPRRSSARWCRRALRQSCGSGTSGPTLVLFSGLQARGAGPGQI